MRTNNTAEILEAHTTGSPVRPKLVKAAEFAARVEAAAEITRGRSEPTRMHPVLRRAPRGEDEARHMFETLFEAA